MGVRVLELGAGVGVWGKLKQKILLSVEQFLFPFTVDLHQ